MTVASLSSGLPSYATPLMSFLANQSQDLKAACDWLAKNDISGVAYEGNPLDKLATVMPKVDPEMVQRRLYGSKHV